MDSLSTVSGMRINGTAPLEIRVQVGADADIVASRQKGREFARYLGFTLTEATLVTTAISELARNIIHYAKRGEILLGIVQKGTRRGLRIIARDDGPGIPDIEAAMAQGFTTSGGLGLGLPGIKRLMDEFNIISKIGSGTTVTVKKWSMSTDQLPFHFDGLGKPIFETTERCCVDSAKLRLSPKPKGNQQVIAGKSTFVEIAERQMQEKKFEESNQDLKRPVADDAVTPCASPCSDQIGHDADLSRALEAGKRLQEQLRQAQKLESIGTLAAGLVHDFNNILHVVQGHALALVEQEIAPENVVKAGAAIVRAVEQGAALARQLLTTAGKSEAKLEPTDVNGLLRQLSDFITAAFPRTVTILSDLDSEVPNMMADANQINQALLNLCVNAKDAMANGGVLTVRTRTITGDEIRDRFQDAESESYMRISVADTGSGMTEETRSHIFEPFFTTKATGTGLGLPVTSTIVQSQNGFIDVVSEPGCGSTFHIYLPIPKQPAALAEAAGNIRHEGSENSGETHGETLLFVEDEPQQLQLMQTFLTAEGFNVLTARDGFEAVEVHRRFKDEIAVVILDLGLAKLSGWQAFQIMKNLNPKVKGILASGFVPAELKSQSAKGNLSAIVPKPYLASELLAKIEGAIRSA